MDVPTRAAIIIIFSVGLVLSYPTVMHPPLRKAMGRFLWLLAWPFRAVWSACSWMFNAPIQWVHFQKEIPQLAEVAEEKEQELAEAAGRMWLETQLFPHKPRHLIGNADRDHAALTALRAELVAKTFGRPVREEEWFDKHEKEYRRPPLDLWQIDLWFYWSVWRMLAAIFVSTYAMPRKIPRYKSRTPWVLKEIHSEWLSLIEQQNELRVHMDTIPARTERYDRLQSAKELKRKQREEQNELLRPLKSAEIAFEGVQGYIRQLQVRRRHLPTKGSSVLSLEGALEQWQARVQEIEQLRAGENSREEVIEAIHSLERDMALAGTYAVKVVQVERRAQRIQSLHRRLKKRHRGLRLPDEEMKAVTSAVREWLSELWVSARWEELSHALQSTLEKIEVYEYVVLSRVWHLHAGTFEQLLAIVFRPGTEVEHTDMRINPQLDEDRKSAVDGSSKLSPFAGRVHEHDNEDSARFVRRHTR